MTNHPSTNGTHSPSDNYPTNIRSGHSQDADFAENVVIIEAAPSKTSLPEFNEAEPEQQESINLDEAEPRHALMMYNLSSRSTLALISNAVRLYVSLRCQVIFLEKTIFKKCYATDRNVNLMGLDWIDELNLIQFPKENEICQIFALEPTNAENLDSALTYHSGPTEGAACTTAINPRSKEPDVILLASPTSRSAISILNKLVLRRSLAVSIQFAPAAELRGPDLRTAYDEMVLSTWRPDKSSLTPEQPVIPDVMQ
ncbi:hypothetical protein ACTXT7_014238 [Hymenolepis weldensis]